VEEVFASNLNRRLSVVRQAIDVQEKRIFDTDLSRRLDVAWKEIEEREGQSALRVAPDEDAIEEIRLPGGMLQVGDRGDGYAWIDGLIEVHALRHLSDFVEDEDSWKLEDAQQEEVVANVSEAIGGRRRGGGNMPIQERVAILPPISACYEEECTRAGYLHHHTDLRTPTDIFAPYSSVPLDTSHSLFLPPLSHTYMHTHTHLHAPSL